MAGITKKDTIIFWLVGILAICAFIYSISSILLPFVVGIIAAYFLNPTAVKIQKLGFSRGISSILIITSFFLVILLTTILVVPVLYEQFLTFLHAIPTYINYVTDKIVPEFSRMLNKIDPEAVDRAKESAGDVSGYALKIGASVAGNLWTSGMAMLNILSLLFVTPIVTFYMLRDWDTITSKVNSWLPRKHAPIIRKQIHEIDLILSGYIRGQTHVCIIFGIYHAIALTIIGLQFGLFIGLATGLLLFIPYVGALFGFGVGMLVAFFQFGDLQHMMMVAGIFLAGQVLESTIITPNLVGGSVRLHPVWVMFGLLAGGAMFGLLGVFMAIPVTAVIGVLARFFIGKYTA